MDADRSIGLQDTLIFRLFDVTDPQNDRTLQNYVGTISRYYNHSVLKKPPYFFVNERCHDILDTLSLLTNADRFHQVNDLFGFYLDSMNENYLLFSGG